MLVRSETATLTLRKRGKVARFLFERAIECEVPGTSQFVDLNIYCDISPSNVKVSPGSTVIEALPGLYRLHTTLPAALPLYKLVRRNVYYELHGPYDDPEGYWFYRMPSAFDWARARVIFPRNRLPIQVTAVFERDGVDHPAPRLVRRRVRDGIAYSLLLEPDMSRFRTVRFDWKW